MPPPRKRSRLTRHIRAFSGFKFYLGYLDISVILNLFQNPVTKKLEGKRIHSVQNNRNGGNASLIPPYILTGGEKPGNQVVYSNVITHLLRNLEYVLKRSRNMCAMTGLKIQSLTLWEKGVRRAGEGFVECQSNVLHEIDCHPELVSGAHKSLKRRGQSSVYKMLKQVQHDINFLKRTYSHINLFSYSPHKKAAFTLAEVLITLGIIGVVAALTMPTLIANYKNKVLVNQAKNSFSLLSNALTMVKLHNGYDTYEDFMQKDLTNYEVLQILTKELKTVKICQLAKNGCITWKTKYNKKTYDNGTTKYYDMRNSSAAVLADGSVIVIQNFTNQRQSGCKWIHVVEEKDEAGNPIKDENGNTITQETVDNRCGAIKVDVNGAKGPNQLGADTFDLSIYPDSLQANYYTFLYNDILDYENYKEGETYE